MRFVYKYPRPMVTVDIFLLRFARRNLQVLLVQRDREPFRGSWALPGGFVEMDETLLKSAERELQEETGITAIDLTQLGVAGDPGRDPRGRTVTIVFGGIIAPPFQKTRGGDDARAAKWFSLKKIPPLAFDHGRIINDFFEQIEMFCLWQLQIFRFLSANFSRGDFQALVNEIFRNEKIYPELLRVSEKTGLIHPVGSEKFGINNKKFREITKSREQNLDLWIKFLQ